MKKNILLILIIKLFFITNITAENWEKVKKTASNIKSISAVFIQEKHMRILSRPLISKGKFYFSAPASLRWEYFSPVKSILMMHKGNVKSYIKSKNGFSEDSRAKAQAMHIVMQEITCWLKGDFQNNPNFTASLKSGKSVKINLTPKEKSLSKIIKRIELNITQKGEMKSIYIYEGETSYTLIKFRNVIHNKIINDSVFKDI